MTTQTISLRERVYTAIAHQSLLVANGVYSLCDMSVEDLQWLYEQIGMAYTKDTTGTTSGVQIRTIRPDILKIEKVEEI